MVFLDREQPPSFTTKEATQTVVVGGSLWTHGKDGWIKANEKREKPEIF